MREGRERQEGGAFGLNENPSEKEGKFRATQSTDG